MWDSPDKALQRAGLSDNDSAGTKSLVEGLKLRGVGLRASDDWKQAEVTARDWRQHFELVSSSSGAGKRRGQQDESDRRKV
jgi:hypothetical protein